MAHGVWCSLYYLKCMLCQLTGTVTPAVHLQWYILCGVFYCLVLSFFLFTDKYGTVVDLSVLCWCGVQFANWKIMRVIMAYHSLKFIRWTFFFSIGLRVNEMTWRKKILEYHLIILTYLIMGEKKSLLVYDLNIYIHNEHVIIHSTRPYCGWLNIHCWKTVYYTSTHTHTAILIMCTTLPLYI